MNILKEIIENLTKEEVKNYKLLSKRSNNNGKRKDLTLFNFIRKNNSNYQEEDAFRKLYDPGSKNSFYRLKHKVANDLFKSLWFLHGDNHNSLKIHEYIGLCKFYENKNNIPLCVYLLGKAEKLAMQTESYDILDLIYSEFIRLSQRDHSLNPEHYITKRNKNKKALEKARKVEEIISIIKYKIYKSYTTDHTGEFLPILNKILREIKKDSEESTSFYFEFKVFEIISNLLIQNNDYTNFEKYLTETYQSFIKRDLFNKNNHDQKLQMISFMVNAHFILKNYEKSLHYAGILHEEMTKYNKLLYYKYILLYYNSLFINYTRVDPNKAIDLLNSLKKESAIRKFSHYPMFIHYNLGIMYFKVRNFKNSIKEINNLYSYNTFQDMDQEFKVKAYILELMIRFELSELDFLEYRISQLSKEFSDASGKNSRTMNEVLSLISRMSNSQYWKKDKKLVDDLNSFIKKNTSKKPSNELIEYHEWFKRKLEDSV